MSVPEFHSLQSPEAVLILDGGLGTSLEDVFKKDISSALWSASLIDHDPDVIVNAHKAFLEAGAEVILTATYQCAFETFQRAGYIGNNAIRLMREAVSLAVRARDEYIIRPRENMKPIKIALSLGPFGATMTTAQEFGGFYPPPYGPKEYSSSMVDKNTNAFIDDQDAAAAEKDRVAERALEEFHYHRLSVFAGDPGTWTQVDYLAFETVPLVREIRAIRRAVGRVFRDFGVERKEWWVSTVWPGGNFPQERIPGGERLDVPEVAAALLESDLQASSPVPIPNGIGINCTDVACIAPILDRIRTHVGGLGGEVENRPLLVIYPNGGIAYDVEERTWMQHAGGGKSSVAGAWARQLADIVQKELESCIWRKLIVGGCCKTGPEHIKELAKIFAPRTS